jgi:copper(I)-binding protein
MKISIRGPLVLVGMFCLAMIAACGQPAADRSPQAIDPWIRLAPPGAGMLAGYMVLENPGDRAVELVSVSSPAFASIEVHRTEVTDGVARMIAEPRVSIGAGERLIFEPGGRHLMLHGPTQALAEGALVPLELVFDDGTDLQINAIVRRSADTDTDGDPHQHH